MVNHVAMFRVSVAALCISALLLCTRDYNPFADLANVDVKVVAAAFEDGDSAAIFSPFWFDIGLAVRDEIDSIIITASNNRHFTDTALRPPFSADIQRFEISFFDTGRQAITITHYDQNGGSVSKELTLYAFSPLYQPPVLNAYLGNKLPLHTDTVGDNDVLYHWQLGKQHIICPAADTLVRLSSFVPDGKGALWVSDLENRRTSPRMPFSITVYDTTGPDILCLNADSARGDTILTSSQFVALTFRIVDQSRDPVDSASVNGAPFAIVNKREQRYTSLFENLDQHTSFNPLTVNVLARDSKEHGNWSERRYWLAYDPAADSTASFNMRVINPAADTVRTSRSSYPVFGVIEDYARDFANIALAVNDSGYSRQRVRCNSSDPWSWEIGLSAGGNTVVVSAENDSGDLLARREFTITYDINSTDSTAPVIWDVRFNGRSLTNAMTADSAGVLELIVFDEGSGVANVMINGSTAESVAGLYRWSAPINGLVHQPQGNAVQISITDRAANAFDTSLILFRNVAPRITRGLSLPYRIIADSLYVDSVAAYDEDGDYLTLHTLNSPSGLAMSPAGPGTWSVRWRPAAADTGAVSLSIYCTDPYQSSEVESREFYVIPTVDRFKYLAFETAEQDFPAWLTAGVDSLDMTLAVRAGLGKPPYTYSASLIDHGEALLTNSRNGRLGWKPRLDHVGWQRLRVVVRDALKDADTLHARILVVEPNRSCVLHWRSNGLIRPDNALDLSRETGFDTLFCRIEDPDSAYAGIAENYAADIRFGDVVYRTDPDKSGKFIVPLDVRERSSGFDTLIITAHDRAGTCGAAHRIALYYGAPPHSPVALSPADSAVIDSTAFSLAWSGGDPNGNHVSWDCYFGPSGSPSLVAADLTASTFRLSGVEHSGAYAWRVVAHDGKDSAASAWQTVFVRNPAHVQFATAESDFPRILEETVDTMRVVLALLPGTGVSPFVFTTELPEKARVIKETTEALSFYAPVETDIGFQKLRIAVTDALGNSDTLHPRLEVVPQNRHPASLDAQFAAGPSGYLDMTNVSAPAVIRFTISDQDHPAAERYQVAINRGGSVEYKQIDSAGSFDITVTPAADKYGLDTIRAAVTDLTGTSDTATVVVFWGRRLLAGPAGIAGCALWLRADSGVVTDLTGSRVQSWSDISGYGHVGVAASENDILPDYDDRAAWADMRAAVGFNGETSKCWISFSNIGIKPSVDDYTVFVARKAPWYRDQSSTMFSMGGQAQSAETYFRYENGGSVPVEYQSPSVITAVQGARLSIYENGVLESETAVARGDGDGAGFILGRDSTNSSPNYFHGEIAEVLVYKRALSGPEVQTVQQYLALRYDLPLPNGSVFYINTGSSGAPITNSLENIPLAVRLDAANFDFSQAGAGGEGVRVFADDGTALPFDIESWDKSLQQAALWVLAPRVAARDSSQYVFISVNPNELTSGENSALTFAVSNGYRGVYHMHESGATLRDASSTSYDGSYAGTTPFSSGCINGARAFDGSWDHAQAADFVWPAESAGFSITAWVQIEDSEWNWQGIVAYGAFHSRYSFFLRKSDDDLRLSCRLGGMGYEYAATAIFEPVSNTWYQLGISYDAVSRQVTYYLNGRQHGSSIPVNNTKPPQSRAALEIGREASDDYLDGAMDELQILEGPRSADWFLFSYENQKPGSAVVSTNAP